MIQTINVSLSYNNGVQALRNVSVRIGRGEFVFIVGATGSGKSSLLKLLNREEVPTSGQVLVDGKDVVRMRPWQVPRLRRSVGVVFQDFRLLPQRTVWENIAFALHVIGAPGREVRRRTSAALEVVNLAARRMPIRTRSAAASSSAPRSPAPSSTTRRSCWRTSRPGTWIRIPPGRS